VCVCVCVIRVVCARDETSEERCEKKTEGTICLFVTSGFRTNKRRKRDTSVFINKRERERERTHARAHHHSRFSIIIVSDLYQRDREKEWLRERFE
jgi:hypothetical protein